MRADPVSVLIAGGGVAALEAALALNALAEDHVTVELVAPESEFTYRPLSVAEPFRVAEIARFPLERLVAEAGARFRRGAVTSVDPDRKIVRTDEGDELSYDVLLLGLGARPREAVENALTFRGPQDAPAFSALLDETLAGQVHSIAFALPSSSSWPLPLYELALLTSAHLTDHGTRGVSLTIVTPEDRPLALFGEAASEAVAELLALREIDLRPSVTPLAYEGTGLRVIPETTIAVDRVVALPRLEGPALPGIPHDGHGFVSTDEFGRVEFEVDIYAAGDMTKFPVKQGGIAAQQADVAASAIAERAGAPVAPMPFRPVLRGLLLTGMVPRYLRADPGTATSIVDTEALWWPPAKIVGRYLAPFLAAQLGLTDELAEAPPAGAVPVEVELEGA